jgi:Reverse transcriptase (RNA-dependent DNA polymerase)
MFIMSLIAKLEVVQIDYTNVFAQATLTKEVYIKITTGFEKPGIILKLLRLLYGLLQAPQTFYEHLATNLTKFGFCNEKNIDPCLWIHDKEGIICLVYVDDCLFFSIIKSNIMDFIKDMEKVLPLTVSDTANAFLGIEIE